MSTYRLFHLPPGELTAAFFLLIILVYWLGYRYRLSQIHLHPENKREGLGAVEGSLIGLTALFLSFSFSMTAAKYEERRKILVEEANNIGTAILRTDLYPDSIRLAILRDFKKYVDARIDYYKAGDSHPEIDSALQETTRISGIIWNRVIAFSRNRDAMIPSMQMIPALNSMIDIVTTREEARITTVPRQILWVLFLMMTVSAFLAGYGTEGKGRNLVLILSFAVMTSLTFYLIIELDQPQHGGINLSSAEKQIESLRSLLPHD